MGGREGAPEGGAYVRLGLIRLVVQQKPVRHCKSNYPPIKNKLKYLKEKQVCSCLNVLESSKATLPAP